MRLDYSNYGIWLEAIAETEILLVELRSPRTTPIALKANADIVVLANDIRLVRLDPRTIELHSSISSFSVPEQNAIAALSALLLSFPSTPPQPEDILFVPPCDDETEGSLVQISYELRSELSRTRVQQVTLEDFRNNLGEELLSGLLQINALSRG